MERELDKGKQKEAIEPIMMDEDQTKNIMEKSRRMCTGIPYQYNMNRKKRSIADKEGLESDGEEVEDIRAMQNIEETIHATYERKRRGTGSGIEGKTLV
jgi:hypothetical protein